MANRPLFVPIESKPFVKEIDIEFLWHPGMSVSQAQKSIDSLHDAASESGFSPVLEVSTKSREAFGQRLSAFRLAAKRPDTRAPVALECVFQAAKVFRDGGPFLDLLDVHPRDAKRDERLRSSGPLRAFRYGEHDWPLEPTTGFYDWLYLSALTQTDMDWDHVGRYQGFTDISFNPKKSINCQARSIALGLSLARRGELELLLQSPEQFREECYAPARGELF